MTLRDPAHERTAADTHTVKAQNQRTRCIGAQLTACAVRLRLLRLMPQAIRFMSNEAQSLPVQRYGKYHLVRKLASGGMAEIFLAKQVGPEGFEKNVVIKRLHAHLSDATDFVTMFHDEAKIVARLAHPNVVQVLELGTQDGSTFMAMEYLAGEDFSNVVLAAVERGEPTPV